MTLACGCEVNVTAPSRIERACEQHGRMSLRDHFAGQAIAGIFASGSHRDVARAIQEEQAVHDLNLSAAQVGHLAEARIADMAYELADAMLKAREGR